MRSEYAKNAIDTRGDVCVAQAAQESVKGVGRRVCMPVASASVIADPRLIFLCCCLVCCLLCEHCIDQNESADIWLRISTALFIHATHRPRPLLRLTRLRHPRRRFRRASCRTSKNTSVEYSNNGCEIIGSRGALFPARSYTHPTQCDTPMHTRLPLLPSESGASQQEYQRYSRMARLSISSEYSRHSSHR